MVTLSEGSTSSSSSSAGTATSRWSNRAKRLSDGFGNGSDLRLGPLRGRSLTDDLSCVEVPTTGLRL